MSDSLRQFRKEKKTLGHSIPPGGVLLLPIAFVKGRVQFDAVEMRCVIAEFVFNSFWIEILEVLLVPLRTADVEFEILLLRFCENAFCVGMVRRDREINLVGIFDLSEFHNADFILVKDFP